MKMIIATFCVIFASFSEDIHLRSLKDAEVFKLKQEAEKPRLFVVFQSNCVSCKQQVRDLQCLRKKADVFLVGAFSSEKDLRKEYKAFKTNFRSIYGDKDFKEFLGLSLEVTPQIVFQLKDKKFLTVGLKPCKDLLAFVEKMKTL